MHITDTVGGVTVSTVQLPSGRYETCLFDDRAGIAPRNPSHVVATGMTRNDAINEHVRWVNTHPSALYSTIANRTY